MLKYSVNLDVFVEQACKCYNSAVTNLSSPQIIEASVDGLSVQERVIKRERGKRVGAGHSHAFD